MATMNEAVASVETLDDLATRINGIAQSVNDLRLEFCVAVREAQKRVAAETTLSFGEWAMAHLRKPDGTQWSLWTLYKYATYGQDPRKLTDSRRRVSRLGREARQIAALRRAPLNNTPHEVNALMAVWERASPEARAQFLSLINAQIIDRRRKRP